MTVYQADYDLLGSGDAPASPVWGELVDELDVADLESEQAHQYELGWGRETDDLVESHDAGERTIVDGARMRRASDRFVVRGRPGQELVMVARFVVDRPTRLAVSLERERVATLDASPGGWSEPSAALPAKFGSAAMALSVQSVQPVQGEGARFASAHYWFYVRSSARAGGE
jgi:hypothetical protein